ncbi:MAG: hypothetical protein HXX19_18855, partial [Rhodoferax sp.]|nr:hypothetical protein [Rhodoferax sp.]
MSNTSQAPLGQQIQQVQPGPSQQAPQPPAQLDPLTMPLTGLQVIEA